MDLSGGSSSQGGRGQPESGLGDSSDFFGDAATTTSRAQSDLFHASTRTSTSQPGGNEIVRAPVNWLWVGGAAGAVGIALALVASGDVGVNLLGWLIGGIGAVSCVAVFASIDRGRRANRWYAGRRSDAKIRAFVLAVGAAAIASNAWEIARWAGRNWKL